MAGAVCSNIRSAASIALLTLAALLALGADAGATTFPPGFRATPLPLAGLFQPTVVRFAPDGTVFVAERDGVIKRFSSVGDGSEGRVVLDISEKVDSYWDRGLLGLAIDPRYPAVRNLYALYTAEEALPGTRVEPPGGTWNDACPNPPGGTDDGCVVAARLSRITLDATGRGHEQPMLHEWCQQFPSHSIGTVEFGPDGYLYVGAGEGASFTAVDHGQFGGEGADPIDPGPNPCKDPAREGGALRAQDVLTASDPTGLDGAIIRVNADTGEAAADNPLQGDANRRRILAHGLRNPFRFAFRPGTPELWLSDVGWETYEEINLIPNVAAGVAHNFGWPCFEGDARQPKYTSADLPLCAALQRGAVTEPVFQYRHAAPLFPGDQCPGNAGSSPSGVRFSPTDGPYPEHYRGGLFLADYSRQCMWYMPRGQNGRPDPGRMETFGQQLAGPVNLEVGPGDDLYYTDITGTIVRLRYAPGNQRPEAKITLQPPYDDRQSDAPPLDVDFDGSASTDPDDVDLDYAWDLDGDGSYDDSTARDPPVHRYAEQGWFTIGLRVTDPLGKSDTVTTDVTTGNTPPRAEIEVTQGRSWAVGDKIAFRGTADDAQDGPIPAAQMRWEWTLEHCPEAEACHTHFIGSKDRVAGWSFNGVDHGWPSYHRVKLTVRDSTGRQMTETVDLHPQGSRMTVQAHSGGKRVPGLRVRWNGDDEAEGTSATVITNSRNMLSAPTPQEVGPDTYHLRGWSRPVTPEPPTGVWYRAEPGVPTIAAEFDRAPRLLRGPAVGGSPVAGSILSADDGDWTGVPAPDAGRTWQRCDAAGAMCADIAGRHAATYVPTVADVGHRLRIVVSADSRTPEPALVAASGPTEPIAPAPLIARPPRPARPHIGFGGTRRQRVLRHNGLWVWVGCSVHPCKARATTALRVHGHRFSLRSKQRSIARPGTRTKVRLRLSRRQRRTLARVWHRNPLRVRITVTARGTPTPTATARRRVTALRRR